jgi:hypothetical protein
MKLTRHSFLKASGAALVGQGLTGIPSLGSVLEPWVAAHADAPPRAAAFRPHVNTTFAFHGADGLPVPMVLARIVERPADARVEQFSLIFVAAAGSTPPAGIYRLQHPAVDALDLFIAPIGGPGERHPACEACFSWRLDRAAGGQAWIRS